MQDKPKRRLINAYDLEKYAVVRDGHKYVPWASIAEVQTAEATEEKHGRWVFDSDNEYVSYYHCDKCGAEIELCNEVCTEPKPNYCQNCGAKMDGG